MQCSFFKENYHPWRTQCNNVMCGRFDCSRLSNNRHVLRQSTEDKTFRHNVCTNRFRSYEWLVKALVTISWYTRLFCTYMLRCWRSILKYTRQSIRNLYNLVDTQQWPTGVNKGISVTLTRVLNTRLYLSWSSGFTETLTSLNLAKAIFFSVFAEE